MRGSTAGIALFLIAALFPAAATAETRYVAKGGVDAPGCTNPGSPCLNISYAVEQAASGDTIQIGTGSFFESVDTTKTLTFVGAGAGTLDGIPANTEVQGLEGFDDPGEPGLRLLGGGALRGLRVVGGDGDASNSVIGQNGGAAVIYTSSAGPSSLELDHVVLVGGNGGEGESAPGNGGIGISASSGGAGSAALTAHDSEFAGGLGVIGGEGIRIGGAAATAQIRNSRLGAMSNAFGRGIAAGSGAQVTLDSVETAVPENAVSLVEGSMTIIRSRVRGGSALRVTAGSSDHAELSILDSLAFATNFIAASTESKDPGSTATINAVGSTLIGLNGFAAVEAIRDEGAGPATVTLRNSIVRHLRPPGLTSRDLYADRATIDADFSSFTTRLEENGGTATAPGSAHNLTVDPQFVDASKGNFALQGTSPLIDKGNPSLAAEGELDLAGSPRSLDGNLDCAPAPDIGAYEVTGQGIACDAAPTISKFGMTNRVFAPKGGKAKGAGSSARRKKVKHGTKFTYTLSEAAGVKITIERKKRAKKGKKAKFAKVTTLSAQKSSGKQSTPFPGVVKGRPLKPGKYRATITATDSAGQGSAPHRLSFEIVAG